MSKSDSLQELVSAAELYSGGFLKGFTISRAPEFEDWQFETGQILEARYFGIIEKIFYLALKDGDSEAARDWGVKLTRLSPFREDILRKLMQLEAEQGDFNTALSSFRRCKRALAAEGLEPEDETLRMAEDCEALQNRSSSNLEGQPATLTSRLEPEVDFRRRFFRFRPLLLAALFAFILIGGAVISVRLVWHRNRNREPDIPVHIAVLPFKFLCDQEGVEKHAEFFSSELISTLAEDSDFCVVPHFTARRYRDSYLSVREIADELDVDYILDGAAMADREIVRFSVQLIDTDLDECIWSRTCECENSYGLALQTEVILEMESGIRQALFE